MIETYILNINQLCKSCGYRNQISKTTDYKIEIVACGNCGKLIHTPKEADLEEIAKIQETINNHLKEI